MVITAPLCAGCYAGERMIGSLMRLFWDYIGPLVTDPRQRPFFLPFLRLPFEPSNSPLGKAFSNLPSRAR